MFTLKLSKHDLYVQQLCEELAEDYDSISTNFMLKKKKRFVGEIDIVAKRGDSFDLFEVKCSYRLTKARKQAKSLRKHFGKKIDNIYFYCGATASLVLI